MLEALIFDFDGLILDTETPDYQSWQEVFTTHNCVLDKSLWIEIIGTMDHTFDIYAHLAAESGQKIDRDRIRTKRRARYLDLVHQKSILPGVLELLTSAQTRGLKLAVASSSDCNWVYGHLERLGLIDYFNVITCRDLVARTKPDPALYNLAVEKLGAASKGTIALEDSLNGIRAAKAAGLFTVAVPNKMTRSLDFSEADLKLESLAEITMDDLVRRFYSNIV